MNNQELRFRQVHLDFHTSPDIQGIGTNFDPDEFAATLEKARVDSITCFARCHHGMLYYDSKRFPELVHPNLVNKNLLKEQIEACHKRGIKVPIYITVQWDQHMAEEHPEWLTRDENGAPIYPDWFIEELPGAPLYQPGFYRNLCVNSPYRDFLKAHTHEVLETLPVDGLFFDIVNVVECSCKHCQAGMKAEGLDPANKEHRKVYGQQSIDNFKQDMTSFVREFNRECTIFYNKGHIGTAHRLVKDAYTHFELESLPSGFWGYLHFPTTIRYARTLGLDCLGQTGKFHTLWGDFHSFKNQAALEFECFRMLALNAKCMIGDQLDPNGRISQPVYDLIGSVYSQIEQKEPWCKGATPVTEIGVFTPEEFYGASSHGLPPAIMGITRMLQESGHQFDILDSKSDLSRYKVLVLPDEIPVDSVFERKIGEYLTNGGALIASYHSGLNPEKTNFAVSELGIRLIGEAPFSPDFILPKGEIGKGLPETEHVMYMKGLEVKENEGTEVLSDTIVPYFNRTWETFCSHRHTPSAGETGYPGIVRNKNSIYFMHPIFTQYNHNAPRWCKQLFLNALNLLLPQPLVKHNGPTTMQAMLNEQKQEQRWVLHLLHYIPERRSQEIDIIEDVIPLYDINVTVKATRKIKEVVCVPEGRALDFHEKDGRIEFIVPKLTGHQMIALQLEE